MILRWRFQKKMRTEKQAKKRGAYSYGIWSETLAAAYLRLRGYTILARRYKTPVGEIDILARRKNVLVAVEVKARFTQTEALGSLTPFMRARIERALRYYLAAQPKCAAMEIRFDLIAVSGSFFIRHLDNAWRPAP